MSAALLLVVGAALLLGALGVGRNTRGLLTWLCLAVFALGAVLVLAGLGVIPGAVLP